MHEYIGGQLAKLKISFKDPSNYFGADWKTKFAEKGYSTAVCGRVGTWEQDGKEWVVRSRDGSSTISPTDVAKSIDGNLPAEAWADLARRFLADLRT